MSTFIRHKVYILLSLSLIFCMILAMRYFEKPTLSGKENIESSIEVHGMITAPIEGITLPVGYKIQDIRTSGSQLLILSRQAEPDEPPEMLYITLIDPNKDMNSVVNIKIIEIN